MSSSDEDITKSRLSPDLVGPCIGPYTLIREMGSGGMGTLRLVQQKSIEGTDVKTLEAAREELARIRADVAAAR